MTRAIYGIKCTTDERFFDNVNEAAKFYGIQPFKVYSVINGHQKICNTLDGDKLEFEKISLEDLEKEKEKDKKVKEKILRNNKKMEEEKEIIREKMETMNVDKDYKKIIDNIRDSHKSKGKWDLDEICKPTFGEKQVKPVEKVNKPVEKVTEKVIEKQVEDKNVPGTINNNTIKINNTIYKVPRILYNIDLTTIVNLEEKLKTLNNLEKKMFEIEEIILRNA